MTDYLEQYQQDQGDALLEQAKRLERALSALVIGETGEDWAASSSAGMDQETTEEGRWLRVDNGQEESATLKTAGQTVTLSQRVREGKKQSEEPPLLKQLRRLDSAQSLAEGRAGAGGEEDFFRPAERAAVRNSAVPEGRSGVQPARPPMPRIGKRADFLPGGRETLQSSGELTWAEQADRAFRRDSRRYDGGFYLY